MKANFSECSGLIGPLEAGPTWRNISLIIFKVSRLRHTALILIFEFELAKWFLHATKYHVLLFNPYHLNSYDTYWPTYRMTKAVAQVVLGRIGLPIACDLMINCCNVGQEYVTAKTSVWRPKPSKTISLEHHVMSTKGA